MNRAELSHEERIYGVVQTAIKRCNRTLLSIAARYFLKHPRPNDQELRKQLQAIFPAYVNNPFRTYV
jgi:hypothetical protein